MNEENMRDQSNVIYGAPCKVVAASEDRNLMQFANDEPNKVKRYPNRAEELDRLERILSFGADPNWKERMQKDKKSTDDNKQITQAAMPDLGKKLSILEKLLRFGRD